MSSTKAVFLPKIDKSICALNKSAASGAGKLIESAERHYKNEIDSACNSILARKAGIVMLSGPSASGKTTTAGKLAKRFTELGAGGAVISLDDFFVNIEDYPLTADGRRDFESVNTIDFAELTRCLNEILTDGRTVMPTFDFASQHRSEKTRTIDVTGGGIVIIEGIHALNPILLEGVFSGRVAKVYAGLRLEYELDGQKALKTREIRIVRRMIRDKKFRGYSPEQTLGVWDNIMAGEEKWVKCFKNEADILIDTSFEYEPCLYGKYLKGMVFGREGGEFQPLLADIAGKFDIFTELDEENVPEDSMLREFIGSKQLCYHFQ